MKTRTAIPCFMIIILMIGLGSCSASSKDRDAADSFIAGLSDLEYSHDSKTLDRMGDLAASIMNVSKKAFDLSEWESENGNYSKDFIIFGNDESVTIKFYAGKVTDVSYTIHSNTAAVTFADIETFVTYYGDPISIKLNSEDSDTTTIKNLIESDGDIKGLQFLYSWSKVDINSNNMIVIVSYINGGYGVTLSSYHFSL